MSINFTKHGGIVKIQATGYPTRRVNSPVRFDMLQPDNNVSNYRINVNGLLYEIKSITDIQIEGVAVVSESDLDAKIATVFPNANTGAGGSGVSIPFTTSVPFNSGLTQIQDYTGSLPQTFTINSTDAKSGNGAYCLYTANGGSNQPDLKAFKQLGTGIFDNTVGSVNVLVFSKLGSEYYAGVIAPPVQLPKLTTITGLTATAVTNKQINLAWNNTNSSPNESSIKVYRSLSNTFSQATLIASLAADVTSYSDPALLSGTTYYFWVVAGGNNTTSADSLPSASATATTQAADTFLDFTFSTLSALTKNADDAYRATAGGGWSHTGVSPNLTFGAGQDFLMIMEIRNSNSANTAIILDDGPSAPSFGSNASYALYDANYAEGSFVIFNNAANYTGVGLIPTAGPFYIGLRRISGTIEVVYSTNKTAWTSVYTHPVTNNGLLYPSIAAYQNAILYNPQYKLL